MSRFVGRAGDYLTTLGGRVGGGWNRFWFTPTSPSVVCLLRIVFGTLALLFVLSHTRDLAHWFGPSGLLPAQTVKALLEPAADSAVDYRWSYLTPIEDLGSLWLVHVLAIAVCAAFAAGFRSRVSGILTFLIVLAYVHRAPMVTGMWEPVLSMVLLYLCFAPCGSRWSLDAKRKGPLAAADRQPSVAATVATRLIQVHLAGFTAAMGMTKLAGDTWWVGEAVWWLIARADSRLVDLTFLSSGFLLVNLWTHAIVAFELGFGVLVWVRPLRPLVLAAAVLMWSSLALLTGEIAFFASLTGATIAFWELD